MVTTVTLNAAIDRTYQVDSFSLGQMHWPEQVRTVAGGKGINVARILRTLGHEVIASGLAGGGAADFISRDLERHGILADFVRIEEESRLCIAVVDKRERRTTRLDERGPLVLPSELDALKRKLLDLLDRSELLILSGSIPRGVPYNVYTGLVELAREKGVPAVLDTRDQPLVEGVRARPMMLKPNQQELQQLYDEELSVPDGVLEAARELVRSGIKIVFASLGPRGAIVATADNGDWVAQPPDIDVVSAVGSGDAAVGGFASGTLDGMDPRRCIARAIGAAAANAATFGACACSRDEILRLAALATVRPLE
ncbi:MAG: 1-phosphofructokinase [Armatimonadota bacterium]